MNADTVIFFFSAVVAVFGATMMIVQRNPVASVLYMILSLVAQAVCYIQLSALFLGAVLVIVYAGAILVLFLFVIMLLNLRGGEDLGTPTNAIGRVAKFFISFLMVVELVMIVRAIMKPASTVGLMAPQVDNFGAVADVAKLLFTRYLYPFELTGILLLVAIVGAVVLSKRDDSSEPVDGPRANTKASEGVAD